MDFIKAWLNALRKELLIHKGKVALAFGVLTLLVVVVGLLWPKKYEVSSVVFADDQNIIGPLLSGSAEVTRPDASNQINVVRDRILSPSILSEALVEAKFAKPGASPSALEPMIRGIRGAISVTDTGRNHFRISYKSRDPSRTFALVSAITDVFIRDSSEAKRQESREAYNFIDDQLKLYKEQLQSIQNRIKKFKSEHDVAGGSETRLAQIRGEVSQLQLNLQIAKARRNELSKQLSQESQFTSRQIHSDDLRDKLAQAQQQLQTLRLSYSDSYPDVVSLKEQIQELRKAIANTQNQTTSDDNSDVATVNPVYTKLRGDLADADVDIKTLELKLRVAQKSLSQQQNFSKQDAEYEAQLAEMTRGQGVIKHLYDDMLQRKERARLSVALDVEGQGVSYKIKQPPIFPTVPVGMRFLHFFLLAPFIGLLVPLGLLVAYIQLDPRIRFVDKLAYALPESVPVFVAIPHMTTMAERTRRRGQLAYVAIFVAAVLVVYVAIGVLRVMGVL